MTALNTCQIIYEDEALVVLEKPAGLPSCPAKPSISDPNTVEGWLQNQCPGAKLVHRLDNDTSGLMIAAKSEKFYEKLKNIWTTPKVIKKIYCSRFGQNTFF